MNKVKLFITALLLLNMPVKAQDTETIKPEIKALYTTTETDLRDWMSYLTSPECRGRLTGDPGFFRAVNYTANLFKEGDWSREAIMAPISRTSPIPIRK